MAESLFVRADEVIRLLGVSKSEAYRIIKRLNDEMASKDNFTHCWQAVFHISMPALKGTVSPKLVDTIRFYRQHKVSGLRLLANYCQFNKYRTQMGDPINPWLEFQYAIKGKQNAAEGISITETAFNRIDGIKNEMQKRVKHKRNPIEKHFFSYFLLNFA